VLVDLDCLADYVRICAEVRLPQPVADHRYRRAARLLVFCRQKAAPEDRPHTKHVEIICRRNHAPHTLRFPFACEAHRCEVAGRDARKALLPVAHGFEIGIRKAEGCVSALAQRQGDNLIRCGQPRNRIEQGRVDPGENRGVRADTQRERQDGNRRISRSLGDHSRAVAYVLP
jgi:hypothetical protein